MKQNEWKTNGSPLEYFRHISAIPRASGNESGIAGALCRFALENGLAYSADDANNVLIKKPASTGREHEPALLLQSHTDMVAEKKPGVSHDFEKDGIQLTENGGILSAQGTTLGADDGIGVAMILSILADSSLSHPALECLFTSGEEVGMIGARAFDFGKISARTLVNLDSSSEDEIIIGCCGGLRTDFSLPVAPEKVRKAGMTFTVSGLAGGHSGEDIDKKRCNALVLAGKLLDLLGCMTDFRLSYISGGDKDNAIPRECTVTVLPDDIGVMARFSKEAKKILAGQILAQEDRDYALTVEETPVDTVLSAQDTSAIVAVLHVKSGVLCYRKETPVLPATSRNLARIRTEGRQVKIGFSSRFESQDDSEASGAELEALADRIGAEVSHSGAYPGWVSAPDSDVAATWHRAYREVTGKDAKVTVIHAGLECGLFSAGIQGLSAISVGCNIYDLHTPAERLEISSAERIYRTLTEFLKKI